MKIKLNKLDNRGTILMLVVISAFIMSVVGMGSISLMGMQEIQARSELDVARVQQLADAGLELAKIDFSDACQAGKCNQDFIENKLALKAGVRPSALLGQCYVNKTVVLGGGTVTYSVNGDPANDIKEGGASKLGYYVIAVTATVGGLTPGSPVTRKFISQQLQAIRSANPEYFEIKGTSLFPVRGAATCTLLDDGRVLYTGGDTLSGSDYSEGDSHAVNNVTVFDPNGNGGNGQFSEMAPLIQRREEHTATKLANGTILIAGGFDGKQELDSVEIYDPLANGGLGQSELLVGAGSRMTDPRMCHVAVFLRGTNEVLILGGFNGRNANTALSSADIFRGDDRQFVPDANVPDMHTGRHCFNVTVLNQDLDGRVLIPGGSNGENPTNRVEIYNRATNTFTDLPNLSAGRLDACCIQLNDGRVLIVGGHDDDPQAVATADICDPVAGTTVRVPQKMSQPRADMYLSYVPGSDNILISGGVYKEGEQIPYVEEFNPHAPKNNQFFKPWRSAMLERVESENNSCVQLRNGTVIFAGGWTHNSGSKLSQGLRFPIVYSKRQNTYIEGPVTRAIE